jgi:hypothetical protein
MTTDNVPDDPDEAPMPVPDAEPADPAPDPPTWGGEGGGGEYPGGPTARGDEHRREKERPSSPPDGPVLDR